MSNRAYKAKITTKASPSFNLSDDQKVCDWLYENTDIWTKLGPDGTGIFYLSLDELKRLVSSDIEEEARRALTIDINEAEKNGADFILYYIY